MSHRTARLMPWLLLLALAVTWGSSFILIKRGLEHYDAFSVGALRVFVGAVVLVPWAVRALLKLPWRMWLLLFVMGMCGNMIPSLLFPLAQLRISSALSGVLNALTPFFVLLVGVLFYAFRMRIRQAMGVMLGFLGAALLLLVHGKEVGFALSSINGYALYAVFATICYGVNINLMRYHAHGLRAVEIASAALLLVLPIACGILWQRDTFHVLVYAEDAGPWYSLGAVAILGLFSTSLAFIFFARLVKLTGPLFSSSVTYLVPIVSILWGVLDGEELLMMHYFGTVCILLGVFLTANRKHSS